LVEEKENARRVNVFLPPDLHDDLKDEAKGKGINVSALIRMILLERRMANGEQSFTSK